MTPMSGDRRRVGALDEWCGGEHDLRVAADLCHRFIWGVCSDGQARDAEADTGHDSRCCNGLDHLFLHYSSPLGAHDGTSKQERPETQVRTS